MKPSNCIYPSVLKILQEFSDQSVVTFKAKFQPIQLLISGTVMRLPKVKYQFVVPIVPHIKKPRT